MNNNLNGNDFANTLTCGDGIDVLNGSGNGDALSGGAAIDTLVGAAGCDSYNNCQWIYAGW